MSQIHSEHLLTFYSFLHNTSEVLQESRRVLLHHFIHLKQEKLKAHVAVKESVSAFRSASFWSLKPENRFLPPRLYLNLHPSRSSLLVVVLEHLFV